ncbi:MAG: hypothetical protein A2V79_10885 [Betaproteobacteria bacterium RBG_16_56_24]|nr:MAG: hypothetical protein A2V79_10885 [Betaproteobacteria bacterium RBG_16_56_24]
MSRLFLLLAIVAVVYLLIRSYRCRDTSFPYRKNVPQQDEAVAEDMVRCAHCGVHLPKGESIRADGHFFCGAGHRDAYLK